MNERPATTDDLQPGTKLCAYYGDDHTIHYVVCFRSDGVNRSDGDGFVTYSPDKGRWGWDPFDALKHYHVHE